jgi:protocatechuate 3,4-dioxygenase beta subunit
MGNDAVEDHDRGLAFDIATLMSRRRALGVLAGIGMVALAGCGASSGDSSGAAATTATTGASASTSTSSAASSGGSCTTVPEETAGPFPGDGSNGPNVLTESGIVRRDIRTSFGSRTGTAEGVLLTLTLTVLDNAKGCVPLKDGAVYVWHCDRDGNYSMYSQDAADQNFLRGVQQTDAQGRVTFTTIYPGAYSGRWPHIHFEVYPSLAEATRAGTKNVTSQLALPKDACDLVYASAGYEQSVTNLAQTSLDRDMVFSDGYSTQLATVSGSVARGMVATLDVPV